MSHRKTRTLGAFSNDRHRQKARVRSDRTLRAKKLVRLLAGFKVNAARWK